MKRSFIRILSILILVGLAVLARQFCPKLEVFQELEQKENGAIVENIAQYLQPDNPRVVKYAQTGNYEVFTLDLTSNLTENLYNGGERPICDKGYGEAFCINVLMSNGEIIFISTPNENGKDGLGFFHSFTDNGVIFTKYAGDGIDCWWEEYQYLSYYNFSTEKIFYGVYSTIYEGKEIIPSCEPEECEPSCEEGNVEWTITTGFTFGADTSPRENLISYGNPLNIQADNIEEAFYKYYEINQ